MRTFLKFKTVNVSHCNGCTTVDEEATIDLSSVRAFSVVRSMPLVDYALKILFENYDGMTMTFKARGVAKCHPDDTFDEKKGFYLAQSRAVYRIYKDYNKFFDYIVKTIDKLVYADIESLYINSQDLMFDVADHIKYDFD